MRISELSKTFSVGKETIRYYREQGLLSPRQMANGYFEYTLEDVAVLFQMLNARQMHKAFSTAFSSYLDAPPVTSGDVVLQDEEIIARIDATIARLTHQRTYLETRARYRRSLEEYGAALQPVSKADGLYFLRLSDFSREPALARALCEGLPTYQSLVIGQEEYLSGSPLLHPEYALGFTEPNYRNTDYYQSCDLTKMEHVMGGSAALRYIVHLTSLSPLPRELFAPVDESMHQDHLRLCAPVTSIILNAAGRRGGYDVLFRFLTHPA